MRGCVWCESTAGSFAISGLARSPAATRQQRGRSGGGSSVVLSGSFPSPPLHSAAAAAASSSRSLHSDAVPKCRDGNHLTGLPAASPFCSHGISVNVCRRVAEPPAALPLGFGGGGLKTPCSELFCSWGL